MAKQKSGGGFIFNVFNIGFTVVMFALPSVLLAYWYMYIRDPGGQVEQVVIVQQSQETTRPKPADSVMGDRRTSASDSGSIKPTGIFSESPVSMSRSEKRNAPESTDALPKKRPVTRDEHPQRTWTDTSGTFSVEAKFYSLTGNQVKLVLADDRKIEVAIAKLSDDDKTYLRGVLKAKGIQAAF